MTLRILTAPLATQLALAAYEDCTAKGYHVAAAVVGRDGRLLAMVRSPPPKISAPGMSRMKSRPSWA